MFLDTLVSRPLGTHPSYMIPSIFTVWLWTTQYHVGMKSPTLQKFSWTCSTDVSKVTPFLPHSLITFPWHHSSLRSYDITPHYVPMTSLLITFLWHHSSLRSYDITPHYVPMKSLLIQINKLYSRIKESRRQTFMNTALRKSVMKFLENSKEPWKYYESWQSILKIILTPSGTLLSNKAI